MPVEEISIIVTPESVGIRLDAFLSAQLRDISRSAIQRAIESESILVNDRTIKASYKVRANDVIEIELLEPEPLTALPENIPLNIEFEDDELIVINKPAGMVVHPGAGVTTGTLANAVAYHVQQLPQTTSALRPGIVHRLDAGTSGLIVVAKTDRAQLHLSAQFEQRTISKRYVALVYGIVKNNEGAINAPIGRDPRNRVKMAVRPAGQGRHALTLYRVQERFAEFTLLDVIIKTGRTHQIRVHLAHLKHPVTGDATYDSGRGNSLKSARNRAALEKLRRPFLHAVQLAFDHPAGRGRMEFTAPPPAELQAFLEQIRMERDRN